MVYGNQKVCVKVRAWLVAVAGPVGEVAEKIIAGLGSCLKAWPDGSCSWKIVTPCPQRVNAKKADRRTLLRLSAPSRRHAGAVSIHTIQTPMQAHIHCVRADLHPDKGDESLVDLQVRTKSRPHPHTRTPVASQCRNLEPICAWATRTNAGSSAAQLTNRDRVSKDEKRLRRPYPG